MSRAAVTTVSRRLTRGGLLKRGLYTRLEDRLLALRLSKMASAVKRQNLTYLSSAKLRRLENALQEARSAGANGAFLEFGVALGGSAILIAHAARQSRKPFFGFDVFGLIPPPSSDKDDKKSRERYETIISGKASGVGGETYYGYRQGLYDEVVQAFRRYGLTVDGARISLLKGLFEETWPRADVQEVAFCHVDCDWYSPVRFCLAHVAPKLSLRGVIVIDDYYDYGGCFRATNEFLTSNPNFELLDGPNIVVRRTK